MVGFLNKLFKKKTFRPLHKQLQEKSSLPPPKLIEGADVYEYFEFQASVEQTERDYMYGYLRFKQLKDKLKKLEDEQFEAVLSGRVTPDESFNFTDRYALLQDKVRQLDSRRKMLRKKMKEARHKTELVSKNRVYYALL